MHSSTKDLPAIKKELESSDCVERCAKRFGTTGDPTRMKICYLLRNYSNLTVTEIATLLDISISATSHSLKRLKGIDVVTGKKEAQNVRYCLEDNAFTRILIDQLGS
jgi:ArsR family transcriptional regulator